MRWDTVMQITTLSLYHIRNIWYFLLKQIHPSKKTGPFHSLQKCRLTNTHAFGAPPRCQRRCQTAPTPTNRRCCRCDGAGRPIPESRFGLPEPHVNSWSVLWRPITPLLIWKLWKEQIGVKWRKRLILVGPKKTFYVNLNGVSDISPLHMTENKWVINWYRGPTLTVLSVLECLLVGITFEKHGGCWAVEGIYLQYVVLKSCCTYIIDVYKYNAIFWVCIFHDPEQEQCVYILFDFKGDPDLRLFRDFL